MERQYIMDRPARAVSSLYVLDTSLPMSIIPSDPGTNRLRSAVMVGSTGWLIPETKVARVVGPNEVLRMSRYYRGTALMFHLHCSRSRMLSYLF